MNEKIVNEKLNDKNSWLLHFESLIADIQKSRRQMDAIIDQIASEMDSLNIHEAAASLASNTNANSVSIDDLGIYLYW